MTEATPPPADPAKPAGDAAAAPATQKPEEWKPEPRQWTWKDLFTAPMLAFKPKCMAISAITLALLSLFLWAWFKLYATCDDIVILAPVVYWAGWAIGAVIFGLGATLVSVFYKADLLDDEFLSLKEALGQFKGRIVPAIMVPLFLVGVLAGFNLLIYGSELVAHLPVVGGLLYALLYPLGFLLGLFTVLLFLGVVLSTFVGPAVVAVRRHGWFDNVIDTFEAVGTKPHVLIAGGVLTTVMILVAWGIGHAGMYRLADFGTSPNLPGNEVNRVEAAANNIVPRIFGKAFGFGDEQIGQTFVQPIEASRVEALDSICASTFAKLREKRELRLKLGEKSFNVTGAEREEIDKRIEALRIEMETLEGVIDDARRDRQDGGPAEGDPSPTWKYTNAMSRLVSGPILAFWKTLIAVLIIGYAINVFLAGGMLTYLTVREDDYWDDEDLEDLDKLAKELEDEAKKDEGDSAKDQPAAPAPAPAADKPAEAKPADSAAPPPAGDSKPA